jgi:hypothetical protein
MCYDVPMKITLNLTNTERSFLAKAANDKATTEELHMKNSTKKAYVRAMHGMEAERYTDIANQLRGH